MEQEIRSYPDGVWVSEEKLHCPDFEAKRDAVESACTDFKVEKAVLAFTALTLSAVAVGWLYFFRPELWIVALLPMVASFAWLRQVLFNYVVLYVKIEGVSRRVAVASFFDRQAIYELEDLLNGKDLNPVSLNPAPTAVR